jgi:hypothetical protein
VAGYCEHDLGSIKVSKVREFLDNPSDSQLLNIKTAIHIL